jgi:N-methylhydantoinase A
VKLHILRSDGGLASARSADPEYPVNLLMSGPAGGVTGALWVAVQAGFPNLLTVDVGGTSTDVALIQNGEPRLRRETTVGDVTVRASSVDIRTVGAGGGSIAHVPELTKALRVGPQSAGADPGPAAYGRGGTEPTVTDANIVLGYLPEMQKLGGDMVLVASCRTRP